ncbi:MAG: acetate--CoA ligase family protein, partial [Burkholderiaceae bacterium]
VELCPMDEEAAHAAIARTRVWQRITSRAGGDRSRFDIDELVATLVRISQLGVAWRDGIETLDVNPLVVKEAGVMALDALIVPRTRG